MELRVIGKPKKVGGRNLRGALDPSGKLWLCEVSPCGTVIEPVFGPVKEGHCSSDNPTCARYVDACREIFRGMRGLR